MKVMARQWSGLGNQLFRYAAGRYLSAKLGVDLCMLVHKDEHSLCHNIERPFQLQHFKIKAEVQKANFFDRIVQSENEKLRLISTIFRRISRTTIIDEIENHKYQDFGSINQRSNFVYLRGYWQVKYYAEFLGEKLRMELSLANPMSKVGCAWLSRIKQAEMPVSLHVRRGDYALPGSSISPLDASYYISAIAEIRKEVAKPTYFVFSDELAYARQILPSSDDFIFVESDTESAYEDLILMANCGHHIIANSSFSWWGAWLGTNASKITFAPSSWMGGPGIDIKELIPSSWRYINVRG